MIPRCLPLVVLLHAVFLPLVGCGGGGGGDGSADGSADGEPIVLRFLDQPDPGGGWPEIIEAFHAEHRDIRVELVEGPAATDAREGLYATSLLSGDTTYDLVYMDVIWVPRFASQGWLLALDEWFPEPMREEFLPGDIAGSIYDRRIWRVPMRSDAGVLFYRSDLVGTPPETFEDLTAAAREHQRPPDLWGFVYQGKQYEGLTCLFLETLWGFGGEVLDDQGRVALEAPEGLAALEWLAATIGTISPEAVATYQEEESRAVFHEGNAVFLRNWPYVWSKAQEEGSAVRGRVGIAPMVHAPGETSAAALGGWGFGIAASSRYPEAAWEFIRFATGPEGMTLYNRANGALPARRALYRDPEILERNPHYTELYEVLLRARPRPVHPKYAQISDAIQVHTSAVLVGQETPREALSAMASEISGILER